MAGEGLVSMEPSSIAFSGSSATINSVGGVDFTAVTSLSLDGVFTSSHDNYVAVCRFVVTTTGTNPNMQLRLRTGGVDNDTANSYVRQVLEASGSSATGVRVTANITRVTEASATQRDGFNLNLYGPFLSQPTAARSVTVSGRSSAFLSDFAWTHNQSTSYDGFTLTLTDGVAITGNVHVFGYEE